MSFVLIFTIFLFWRIFNFLVIFFSQKFIPYLGFFPYKELLPGFNLPTWVSALANFDGLHYISIARNGYAQYEQAFFPLYPMLIKYLTPIFTNNELLTGLIISNVSFLIGLWIFYKYLNISTGIARNAPTIIFLLAFPTSFFFGAVYTEGLFFLLLISTLYFLKKEKYIFVMIFAFLASMTRLVGVFLVIPMVFHLIKKMDTRFHGDGKKTRATTRIAPTIFAPLIGLSLYCFYLWQTTGDPLFFLTSQPIFGANRSSHLILLPQVYWRYFKIFITAAHDFRFYISVLEFLVFNFVFVILFLDIFRILRVKISELKSYKLQVTSYEELGINLFSFANLILPTLTGTFSSIPRYSLFSISIFIYLAQIKNNLIKYLILGLFSILHILLLGYFIQGYFVS